MRTPALSRADVVLGLGCTVSDLTTYEYTLPVEGEVILVNIDGKAMVTSYFRAQDMIEADVGDFLELAIERIKGYEPPSRDAWWEILKPGRRVGCLVEGGDRLGQGPALAGPGGP